MGLKYFSKFSDVDGNGREVRFFNDAFSGSPIEWINSSGAIRYRVGDSDSLFPDQPIIASQVQIGLILKELYDLSEFVFDRKTFFVQIVDTDFNKIKWSGWVEPWNAAHKYVDPPHEVTLTASCGLAHLSRKKYVNPSNTFRKTGLTIIQECLGIIEAGDLALRLSTHMVENSFSGNAVLGLTSFEIDTQRYYDNNGEAMYCDVIVNDILNHFNAELVQWDNKWVIRGVVDHATALQTNYQDIGDTSGTLAWPGTYSVNGSQSKSLDDGQIRVLAPITKYRTEIDFGQQTPFFENGSLLLWNENGLIGWDFTHMTKGNPGWEQFELGGESNKSVLKINGKSPQPYRKRKKVKLFKKLTNQAINIAIAGVGAVGALFNKPVLKGAWEDIEPAEWIESPGGPISKADKSVTISFEYETEAFSSDILISIKIPVTKPNGDVVNFWVDPSSQPALNSADKTHAGADDKFHLIRVPPVDRGSLINRGDLNAASNPNYPAASAANWTWTVTGVPSGEYRKVGGVNGVNVENGDLIISRVPNVGGTQEAVGGNFEIVSIRNNIRKGTYQIAVSLNTTFLSSANQPFPADKVYVRFYKIADEEGRPGDWYKIYDLNGQLEGFVASTESSKYATTLERGGKTDEEAQAIQLISGDFTPWYLGAWRKPGSNDLTSSWKRRSFMNEGMSIYRAMMLDRLCMTSRPLNVFEGQIKLLPGYTELSYLHRLSFVDQDDKRFRIVRYEFEDYRRIATITAVEIKYEEIPKEELRQDSYIPGSHQLNTIPGQGDGIYPSKQDSTNGRLNAEDLPLTEDELLEVLESGSRLGVLFDEIDPLVFEVGSLSTKYRNLADYLSEVFLENEDEFEDEDTTDFAALEFSVISKPTWVSNVTKDELIFGVTGKPTAIGQFILQIGLFDPEEPEFIIPVEIPIIVYPKTTIKYTLRDTSGLEPIGVGNIVNGSGHMKPDAWDILVQVTGHHEGWFGKVSGMGINIQPTADPYSLVSSSDTATYIIGSDIESDVGIYNLIVATFRDEGEPDNLKKVKEDKIKFSLYDEEYLDKAQFELWGTESNTLIGPIDPDGSSAFNVEEAWDVKMIIEGVEHDAGSSVLGSEVGDLDTNVIGPLDPAVEDASYFQLGEVRPEFDPSAYNVLLTLSLEGDEQYARSATFTINKDKVKPVGGNLKLVSMITNTTNYDVMGTLAINGNLFTLPSSGWNVLLESNVVAGAIRKHQVFQKKGDSLININTQLYTGKSQTKSYPESAPEDQYFIFDFLSSLDIDKIHLTPSSFRVIITDEVDGVVTNIYQADFSFGVLEDLDDLDISEPGNAGDGVQEHLAGFGLSEVIDDYIKTFNVNTDNLTIEVFSPTNPAFNWLRVKAKGITHAHYQDIASLSILGNLGGSAGSPYEVPIITSITLAGASNLNIATTLAVKTYVDTALALKPTGNGLLNRFVVWTGTNTQASSNLFYNGGNVGVGMIPGYQFDVLGAIRCSTQFASTMPTGFAPIDVTSTTLCTNLNADLLDGFHASAFALASHTHTIAQVTGLQASLDSKVINFGNGVANRFALWVDNTQIGNSNLYYNAGNIGVGMVPGYQFDVAGSIRFTNQLASTIATGTAPLDVTSTTLCVNLNADLLDGFHASAFALASHTHTIAQVTGLQASLDSKVINFGNGVANRFALWVDNNTIGNSNLYYNSGNIGVGMVPGYQFDVSGSIRYSNQLASTVGTGTAPLDVASTTLCVNLHADYLSKSVIAGSGLTGGGLLTSNVTLNVAFGFTAGTAAEGDDLAALIARNITVNGTSGRISSSAGAQNLSADRSWTLDLVATGVAASTYKSVTVDVYGRVTGGSNPTTLAGYGITDAYVITDVNYLLDFKADKSTVLTINGVGYDLSANRTWNVGTISGSATTGYFPKMATSASITDSVMRDTGSEINVGAGRSFGVEGPAAMRDYLHVHNYVGIGKSGQHGALVIHSASSATAHATAAIDIQSTTKGVLFPRMTESQRQAIPSPPVGLVVYQTDVGDGGPGYYGAQGVDGGAAIAWVRFAFDFVDYI
jgi:hypothetical protein